MKSGDVDVLTVNSWGKRAGFFLGRPAIFDLFGQIVEFSLGEEGREMEEVASVVTLGNGTIKVEQNGKQIIVESFGFRSGRNVAELFDWIDWYLEIVANLPNAKYELTKDINPVWRKLWGVMTTGR